MRGQMPTRYGRSPWIDQFPKSRVPTYPAHRGPLKVGAAIVGGGSTGWIAEDPGIGFVDAEKLVGSRRARQAWDAWRRAALDFAALIRRLDLKCDLERRGSLLIATTPEQITRLTREQK